MGNKFDDHVDMEFLDLLVEPHKQPVQSGVESPVDGAVVVLSRVMTEILELPGEPRGRGRLNSLSSQLLALPQSQEQGPKPLEKLGVENIFIRG